MKKLLVVLLLAGCATEEQRRQAAEDYKYQVIVTFGPRCESAGFRRGSQEWERCIVALHNQAVRAGRPSFGDGMRAAGKAMQGSGGVTTCRPGLAGSVTCAPGY